MNHRKKKQQQIGEKDGVIAVTVLSVITAIVMFFLLVYPVLTGGRQLNRYMDCIDTEQISCVILQDPRYPSTLFPVPVEYTAEGEEAREILEGFLSAMDKHSYHGSDYIPGGLWTCFMRVDSGNGTVFFYFTDENVYVEENSTYYSFSPKGKEGIAAYAEWYANALSYIDGAAG